MQKVSPHGSHVFRRIKISQTNFEKGHPRNITVKLFPNRTRGFREEDFLRISSCPYSAKSLPLHGSHVFRHIKISLTIFEKGSPQNNPVKLFQNLTSSFKGEEFWRISLKCTKWNQILRTIFKEDYPKTIPPKFGSNWPRGLGGVDV